MHMLKCIHFQINTLHEYSNIIKVHDEMKIQEWREFSALCHDINYKPNLKLEKRNVNFISKKVSFSSKI